MCYRKHWFVAVTIFAAGLAVEGTGIGAPKPVRYDTYEGFVMSAEPVLTPKERHPSLWFSQNEIGALRRKADADDYARQLWQQLSYDPLLTCPLPEPPQTTNGDSVQGYYGKMSRLAQVNALMFLLGDEANRERYKARAVAALKRAYDGPIYQLSSKEKSNGVDEIYRGTWLQNFCAAYDWVQASLSAEDDQAVRERLAKEGQTIYENLYAWASRPHNHLSKPAWGLATLALTLSDHANAKPWLARALEASNKNTKYFFSADGIYREGNHYFLFSAINFIPFLYHYRNVSGVDGFAVFQPAFEAVVATRNGRGWLPNLYDSYLRPFPTHMVAAPYLARPTWLNPGAKLGNILQWSFQNTDFSVFEKAREKTGYNYTGATVDYALHVDEFLTYDPTIKPIAPGVSPTISLKGGQTVFRNNWSFNDPAQRYLLFHGVAAADNHFHFDCLSFIIQAENQMMASDAGYSRKSYGESIRKDWYMTPAAHNVVTADGQAPIDTAENVTPLSRDSIDTAFFDFQEKEALYPNKALQRRAIAFPGEEYFVVIDRLTAPQPVDYALFLHGGRGDIKSDGIRRVWSYSHDQYGSAAQLAAWVLSDGAKLEDKKGELTYIKGDYAEFGYVTAAQRAQDATFMQILIPLPASATLPTVTDLSGKSAIAATVVKSGVVDTFVARRDTAQAKAGKLETDGRFAWTRSKNGPTEWALQEGTALVYDGVDLVKASVPITIAGRTGLTGFEAAISTGSTNYTLDLPLKKKARVKSVSFNGAKAEPHTDAGHLSVSLSGGGKLMVEITAGD